MSELVSRTSVEIMGRSYTLKGDVDPTYMQDLAKYVNAKIGELKSVAPDMDLQRLVLLMSLNLADELFQARSSESQALESDELKAMQDKTTHLIHLLEEGLIGEDLVH